MWSDGVSWTDLIVPVRVGEETSGLDLGDGWQDRWVVSWKAVKEGGKRGEREVRSRTVRQLVEVPMAGPGPVRTFSWGRNQGHRPGLQYMVSTGRHHGFESLEEAKVLLALDFAGEVVDVVSQPLQLQFATASGVRGHVPDYLAVTRAGRWLVDVRPERLIKDEDRQAFAAAAEAALACGWAYMVVGRWREHVVPAVDAISSQRRPLRDPLGLQPGLLAAAAGRLTFGELAVSGPYEPVARAQLLHLLWRRRLGVDLSLPLGDGSAVRLAAGAAR